MKMIYLILAILLIGLAYFFISKKTNEETSQTKVDPNNNPYKDLRNLALNATAEQLQLKLTDNKVEIYGVIMDWDLEEGTATLISFSTGDASLYLSSGGGYIGSGGYDNVKTAINSLIAISEKHLNKATLSETTELPEKNGLTFYFLTNKGKYRATEKMANIENESSSWLDLFNEANKLITEIRVVSENKTNS